MGEPKVLKTMKKIYFSDKMEYVEMCEKLVQSKYTLVKQHGKRIKLELTNFIKIDWIIFSIRTTQFGLLERQENTTETVLATKVPLEK